MQKRKIIQGLVVGAIGGTGFLVAYPLLNYLGANQYLTLFISLAGSTSLALYVAARYFPREQFNDTQEEIESPASDDTSD